MSLDGLFIHALADELAHALVGGRIDRIFVPANDQVMISVRQPGVSYSVVASSHPQWARISLTNEESKNPDTPPGFCMILRKHLSGGRVKQVYQPSLERIVRVSVESYDEYGVKSLKDIVVEIMGKHSNILLVDVDSCTILDCMKHVPSRVNAYRELLPNRPYILPPPQDKLDLVTSGTSEVSDVENALERYSLSRSVKNVLVDCFKGFGPLIASEVAYRAGVDGDASWSVVEPSSRQRLAEQVYLLAEEVRSHRLHPSAYTTRVAGNQRVEAFSFTTLSHRSDCDEHRFDSLGELLDYVFATRERSSQFFRVFSTVEDVVKANLDRAEGKLRKQLETLEKAENAEEIRKKADLIMANQQLAGKGRRTIEVVDYFDPSMSKTSIDLDPALTLVENAQRYYKRYAKARRSLDVVRRLIDATRSEVDYLSQVHATLACASSYEELEEIREELEEQGYIKAKMRRIKKACARPEPKEFTSPDGMRILVGKNNRQNDYLTLRLASDDDIWLHVKDMPGSHVIIKRGGSKKVPDCTLESAALLAAYYSKARGSANVPVDWTERCHVRKPKGAKPGMVIYDSQSTVYVTPSIDRLSSIFPGVIEFER